MLIFEEHFQDNRHKWYVHDSAECTAQLGQTTISLNTSDQEIYLG